MGNMVTLIGNLTKDPEIRFTRDGQAVTTIGLAISHRWQNRQNNSWEEDTSFVDIVCWREMAENVAASMPKGCRVIVVGRLEQRSWENEEGEKRYKIEVIAEEIGPSLKWAKAQVSKAQKQDNLDDNPNGSGNIEPGSEQIEEDDRELAEV